MDFFIEMRTISQVVLFFYNNVLIKADWQKNQALQDNDFVWLMSFSPHLFYLRGLPWRITIPLEPDGRTLIPVETDQTSE